MENATTISTHYCRLESDTPQPTDLPGVASKINSLARPIIPDHSVCCSSLVPFPILKVVDRPLPQPFILQSRRRAAITAWELEGFCMFTGMSAADYLEITCLLALTQLKALSVNPLMEPEDFLCDSPDSCLWIRRDSFQEHALLYEKREVCEGCVDFYHRLGVDEELVALLSKTGQEDMMSRYSEFFLQLRGE